MQTPTFSQKRRDEQLIKQFKADRAYARDYVNSVIEAGNEEEITRMQSCLEKAFGTRDIDLALQQRPLMDGPVQAGFPIPTEAHVDHSLNLNDYCIRDKANTFFLRVVGDSMIGAGIFSGDLIVVDRRTYDPKGRVVVAAVDGEVTVKRLVFKKGRVLLMPENPDYSPIDITDNEYVHIWGVVTYVIHPLP